MVPCGARLSRRVAAEARWASVSPAHIREYCELDETSKALMRSAMNQLGMSARTLHRVLKLARIKFKPYIWPRRFAFGRPRRQG